MTQLSVCADALIAGLFEDDAVLRQNALKGIYLVVDQCWSEISDALPLIEELSEDGAFPSHELAAAVASRIFFHLEEYDDALRLALSAGKYFNIDSRTEYVEMLVSKCMDAYIETHKSVEEYSSVLDDHLSDVIERMFRRCYVDGEFNHALGMALEARRLDKVEEIVKQCPVKERQYLFAYVLEVIPSVAASCEFRRRVLSTLVSLHPLLHAPDYVFLCRSLQYLGASNEIRLLLSELVQDNNHEHILLGYQLAFMISESENHNFILDIVSKLQDQLNSAACSGSLKISLSNLSQIMDSEGWAHEIALDFMYTKSRTDILIFKTIKDSIDGNRSSVLHNATVISHGYANAGTKDTTFLRNNMEWMAKATNWAKFIATSSIGVIHKGHVKESIRILKPYLPQASSNSPFSEGGALFALGLIHAHRSKSGGTIAAPHMLAALHHSGSSEPLQHGACLGLGLAAISDGKEAYYEELRTVLFFDSAIAGEAAAYGIGLLLLGHGDETSLSQNAIAELYAYAHETSHEKIIRGVALAISLIVCGKTKTAEPSIELLSRDRDAIVRYGGMYAIGLAYAGTGNNNAIRRLLHVAVSDVSDDVRRAAVSCLGLVLFRNPKKILLLVRLLLESFNPHVRYGACMAIGISHSASGDPKACEFLQPLLTDAIDFVRQGALMAMALVLMQQSSAQAQISIAFRDKISDLVQEKYPSTLTKIGAIVAAGIIDAGGRNATIALESSGGFLKQSACAGLVLWLQSWYWYPMFHFFSLALAPTMLVGLNSNFEMPVEFSIQCLVPSDFFAYPPQTTEKRERKKERVATVVLSTTLKHKNRENIADLSSSPILDQKHHSGSIKQNTLKEPRQLKISSSSKLTNPSRLTRKQRKLCRFDLQQRFVPIATTILPNGIIMLVDRDPNRPQETTRFYELTQGLDQELPQPFEWPLMV